MALFKRRAPTRLDYRCVLTSSFKTGKIAVSENVQGTFTARSDHHTCKLGTTENTQTLLSSVDSAL